ncbi:MAG: exonuclease subunit SbcD [Deltaproteobacteria bacterium]|nr:exonuclease subunit SbcD [Deltaproteobacteria bacterium]
MKILHTSDWHLGRTLFGQQRTAEFEAFLTWLLKTLQAQQVEVLLVAGDIFDTTTPSNRAQQLYYRFLCQVAQTGCRHVVITAGNHDSPSFLAAPRELLRHLNVHVLTQAEEDPGAEVLELLTTDGQPELLVCAVPYLRDRDMRSAEAGESIAAKETKLLAAIRRHYAEVVAIAASRRQQLATEIPLVAMGHLFAAGGQTVEGDGVRELYVGSLAHISAGIFPPEIDYLALGHLHLPQQLKGQATMRYSGSPLPMGFGEARQQKSVCLIDFDGRRAQVAQLKVPVFRSLESICGDWGQISRRLLELVAGGSDAWLEIVYTGSEVMTDLRERLDDVIAGSTLEILRVKNKRVLERVLGRQSREETLDDLDVQQVFARCLAEHQVPESQRAELLACYQLVLNGFYEEDRHADGQGQPS